MDTNSILRDDDSAAATAAAALAAFLSKTFSRAISRFCRARWSRVFRCSLSCAIASLNSPFVASSLASSVGVIFSFFGSSVFFSAAASSIFGLILAFTKRETPDTIANTAEPARPATSSFGVTPRTPCLRSCLVTEGFTSGPLVASLGGLGGLPPVPFRGFCESRAFETPRLDFVSSFFVATCLVGRNAGTSRLPDPPFALTGVSFSLPSAWRLAPRKSTAISRVRRAMRRFNLMRRRL